MYYICTTYAVDDAPSVLLHGVRSRGVRVWSKDTLMPGRLSAQGRGSGLQRPRESPWRQVRAGVAPILTDVNARCLVFRCASAFGQKWGSVKKPLSVDDPGRARPVCRL